MMNFPTSEQLFKIYIDAIKDERHDSNPFIKGSWYRAFGKGIAAIATTLVIYSKILIQQFFPQDATGVFLEKWASYETISRLDATASFGILNIETDSAGVLIPSGTEWKGPNGIIYTSDTDSTSVTVGSNFFAYVSVTAGTTGQNSNLPADTEMELQDSITEVIDSLVDENGLVGGAETESDNNLRSRTILSRSSIAGIFTNDQIELAAKKINGNTRIFIQNPDFDEVQQDPAAVLPGEVRVYVIRDNDISIIPTQPILDLTKKVIKEEARLPANMWINDLQVLAPDPKELQFTFTTLSPNTSTMQASVNSQLTSFFEDNVEFGIDTSKNKIIAAIQNTVDLDTGETLNDFEFSSPTSGDLIMNKDNLPTFDPNNTVFP